MNYALTYPSKKLNRFDWLVISILFGLGLATLLLVWRGDQIGVQIIGVTPEDGVVDVSTRTDIRVTFDQPMAVSDSKQPLVFSPPVTGSTRWEGSTLVFLPDTPLAPNTSYTVLLANGVQSRRGRSVAREEEWQFTTGGPKVLYLAHDDAGNDQIFAIDPVNGESTQLTDESFGVFDFNLSPDAANIVYAALREDGGSDLWATAPDGSQHRQLLPCRDMICNGAVWAADSRRLVYERRTIFPDAPPGPPRLWWLDSATADTVPVFGDNQLLGYAASWSPDGAWLSYVSPTDQGIQLYNVEDGRSRVIPSQMGRVASWNYTSDAVLVADVQPVEEGFAVHLLKANPNGGELEDISGEGERVEDGSPVWSPNGEWLALTRKIAGTSMGKQLWLMRPDGSEAHYITNNTEIHHSAPQWSPDGKWLVYQRFPLKELGHDSFDLAAGN